MCVKENKWKRTLRSLRRKSTNHSEVDASIPDIYVDHDNVMTETRDIAVFKPTHGLPRVTAPARKTGISHVSPA